MLGNLYGFRPGDGRGAGAANWRSSTSGSCCAPKTWWRAAAPGTDNFEFHKVYHAVYAFATVDLSAMYFDVLKDRLYTSAPKSKARRSAQTALYRLLDALVRLLAPLMSFTAEEVWGHMGRDGQRPRGVLSGARGTGARASTRRRGNARATGTV